jgi:hypothetical protein
VCIAAHDATGQGGATLECLAVLWRAESIPLLSCAFVVVVAATWLWFSDWRRRTRYGRLLESEPRCGRCGYIIAPDGSTTCPECGSDLLRVGLITPLTLPAPQALPQIVFGAVLAVPAAFFIAGLLSEVQPFDWSYDAYHDVSFSGSVREQDSHGVFFFVRDFGKGRYFGRRSGEIWVSAPNAHGVLDFYVRPTDMMCETRPPDGSVHTEPFSQTVVQRFVDNAAPAVSEVERKQVASEVEAYIRVFAASDFNVPQGVRPGAGVPTVVYYSGRRAFLVLSVISYLALIATITAFTLRWRHKYQRTWSARCRELATQLRLHPG